MEKTQEYLKVSEKFLKESKVLEEALKLVSEKLIAETKKDNGYLIVGDEDGNIKKLYAKDL